MSIWAVTPVKSFKRPKSRLGDVLPLLDRRILVKHMLKSVLFSQEKSNLFKKLIVVTEDEEVIKFSKKFGFEGLLQKKPGLNQGITEVALLAKKSVAQSLFIIHGDIPLVNPSVIKLIFNQHKELIKVFNRGVTISPDTLGEGTNCMICTPPNIIKFHYGPGSCLAHMETAHRNNLKVKLYRSKRLKFDIDRVSDLSKLVNKKGYTRVSDYIKSIENE